MASFIIHLAVANEINKSLKMDDSKILIGSISPDISKLIGESKLKSHFLCSVGDNIPNISNFLIKYKNNLNNPFVMGYFIHLYTDYLWFKYFISDVYSNQVMTKLDGTKINCNEDTFCKYVYNDYTNLNTRLIDKYKLNLDIFNEDFTKIDNVITEIPIENIQLLVDKARSVIDKSNLKKELIFNIDNVEKFIDTSSRLILAKICELYKEV